MKVLSVNPKNLDALAEIEEFTDKQVAEILAGCEHGFAGWKNIEPREKRKLLLGVSELLKNNLKKYSRIITDEMGKTIHEAEGEIKKCSAVCEYYANNFEKFLSDVEVASDFKKSKISFLPIGVVLAIMPWNFPFWQAFRAIIPAVSAGNAVVLKHSSNVSLCALEIENIFKEAGFPENIVRTIIVSGDKTDKVIANKLIRGVTFTGSTDVGRKIAENAGRNLKKCVLELGGNDPYIVLENADIELAARKCAGSRLLNAGQSCIAAKRFIVSEKVYAEFLEKFTANIKAVKFGDPYDDSSKIGPLVSVKARDAIHKTVHDYVEKGAVRLICGGVVPDNKGAFYPPTILEVIDRSKIRDEEVFGPVAIIFKAKNDLEAIEIANSSDFGLGAAIFSKNEAAALEIAKNKIESGSVFINDYVQSNQALPFGGVKNSGFGRELSEFGIKEFTNIKTVVLN